MDVWNGETKFLRNRNATPLADLDAKSARFFRPEFSTTKLEHETPVPGILGIASLMASIPILATRRRAEEPEAKNAVKKGPTFASLGFVSGLEQCLARCN